MAEGKTAFVSLRLDAELVKSLDQLAETEGLTRTAVIERMCRREFTAMKIAGRVSALKSLAKNIDNAPITPSADDPIIEVLICGPGTFNSRPGTSIPAKIRGAR